MYAVLPMTARTETSDSIGAEQLNEVVVTGEKPEIKRRQASRSSDYDFFRRKLEDYFPVPVKFSRDDSGKGSITLKFSDDDQLRALVALFERLKQ